MPDATPPKFIFKSKIVIAGLLTTAAGALGTFSPEASTFLATHASTILLVVGALNVILRLITKGRVVLYADSN